MKVVKTILTGYCRYCQLCKPQWQYHSFLFNFRCLKTPNEFIWSKICHCFVFFFAHRSGIKDYNAVATCLFALAMTCQSYSWGRNSKSINSLKRYETDRNARCSISLCSIILSLSYRNTQKLKLNCKYQTAHKMIINKTLLDKPLSSTGYFVPKALHPVCNVCITKVNMVAADWLDMISQWDWKQFSCVLSYRTSLWMACAPLLLYQTAGKYDW